VEEDRVKVAMVGGYHTDVARDVVDRSLEEMIFEAARGALDDAGLDIGDIDGVILTTSDQASGRVIESMVTNGAAGGVGRDVTTLASAGEHALMYGYLRLLASQGRRLLVVAWSKESESVDPRHAQRVAAEPFLLRPLGMDLAVAAGLQAGAYTARYGVDADASGTVRDRRWQAAAHAHGDAAVGTPARAEGYVAWPLTASDLPHVADLACAVVLATEDVVVESQDPAWITGVGWSTDRYNLGERDLTRFEALEVAARQAFGDRPPESAVFEVQEISTVGAFAAYEALGLCPAGDGATVAAGDHVTVNPSGGNLPLNPGNAAGFLRLLNAAQQVRGRAGTAQVEPPPATGVGAALHGFAGQGAAVMVFSAEKQLPNQIQKVSQCAT
jgi:hypothetical protein